LAWDTPHADVGAADQGSPLFEQESELHASALRSFMGAFGKGSDCLVGYLWK